MSQIETQFHRLMTIFFNPIWVKCARARMRPAHLVSWGVVTLTVTAFVSVLMYTITRHQGEASVRDAAKAMVVPVVVVQALLLLVLGTGAVASKLSFEREFKLLDYHRLTPMAPLGKIFGYLFGLPSREYVLFALTLPFLIFAVVVGEIPLERIVPFYVVFFSSAVLYHLTGMVAGMASAKPRRAQLMSQGLIILIYLFLPQMSAIGLTFLEFLTFVPTFNGLVQAELETVRPGLDQVAVHTIPVMRAYQDVPFFGLTLHPTVFTLIVQGFLILTMFVVVYRKWLDESAHIFSKLYGFIFYGGFLALLLGSLWPAVAEQRFYGKMLEMLGNDEYGFNDASTYIRVLFGFATAYAVLTTAMTLLVAHFTTPSRQGTLKGLRRVRKLRQSRLHFNQDAASSLPLMIACIGLTWAGWIALLKMSERSGGYFESLPGVIHLAPPFLLYGAIVLFFQGMRERFSIRACLVAFFMIWMVPTFVSLIMIASETSVTQAFYLALPFPPFSFVVMHDQLFSHVIPFEARDLARFPILTDGAMYGHAPTMITWSLIGYGIAATLAQIANRRRRRELVTLALETELPRFVDQPVDEASAAPLPTLPDPEPGTPTALPSPE